MNISKSLLLLLFTLIANSVLSNSLVNLDFAPTDRDSFELSLTFTELAPRPEILDNETPARIVLDFTDIKNRLPQSFYPLSFGSITNIQALSSKNITRIIINMDELVDYRVGKDKKILYVVLGSSSKAEDNGFTNKNGDFIESIPTPREGRQARGKYKTRGIARRDKNIEDEAAILWNDQQVSNDVKVTKPSNLPKPDPLNLRSDNLDGTGIKALPSSRAPRNTGPDANKKVEAEPDWDLVFEGFDEDELSETEPPQSVSTQSIQAPQSQTERAKPNSSKQSSKPFQQSISKTIIPAPESNQQYVFPQTNQRQEQNQSIVDFDFNRGELGEAIVKIVFAQTDVDVDIQRHHRHVVFQFQNCSLPQDLVLRFDVQDFNTIASFIDLDKNADQSQLKVEVNDDYDYFIYQTGDTYYIYLNQRNFNPPDGRLGSNGLAYQGKPVSINFQDIDIRAALQVMAELVDVNMVASDSIKGKLSLHLESVPWDQAIDIILQSKGLVKQVQGNVLMVGSAEELAQLAIRQQQNAPMSTLLLPVQHANAQQLNQLIANSGLLSNNGHSVIDERTNTLIITDTDYALEQIKATLSAIDIPLRQVAIEARIVVANTNFRKDIGVKWGLQQTLNNNLQINGTRAALLNNAANSAISNSSIAANSDSSNTTSNNPGSSNAVDSLAVNLSATNPAASIDFGILSNGNLLDIELSAMENNGQGEVISTPKIITGDKQSASIRSGQEFAFFNRDSDGLTSSTSFKQAVLALNVTPQITPDDKVILDLDISQDAISGFNADIPIIDVTNIKTTVTVDNGNTLILGGVYQTNQSDGVNKVPLLGDIPILGKLFRRQSKSKQKQEILIFITPTILGSEPQLALAGSINTKK